ncbi:MAG TPA: hypothetical protein VFE82_03710 [Ramlibacter sp.]|jgi:hypothetical protein|uniref:hypothetical protein n=1 Tax=Ramlibacter sp. TaxID=1917967 RepID=UPI002D35EB39|nr:hypothetical protein [Ramlibacter sp.]HZY17559.1 hypothetical protein [Ramlibacter sp.]
MNKRLLSLLILAAFGSLASAKLAPLDDAAKAKAAETAAKAAWQAKVDAWQLCKSQDRVAARYRSKAGSGAEGKAMPVAAKPATGASAAGGAATPVAAAAPAPCVDPGAFAYSPPEQKPLETSGAHSPAGTAASPPSVRPEAAQMTPGSSTPTAPAAKKP